MPAVLYFMRPILLGRAADEIGDAASTLIGSSEKRTAGRQTFV